MKETLLSRKVRMIYDRKVGGCVKCGSTEDDVRLHHVRGYRIFIPRITDKIPWDDWLEELDKKDALCDACWKGEPDEPTRSSLGHFAEKRMEAREVSQPSIAPRTIQFGDQQTGPALTPETRRTGLPPGSTIPRSR